MPLLFSNSRPPWWRGIRWCFAGGVLLVAGASLVPADPAPVNVVAATGDQRVSLAGTWRFSYVAGARHPEEAAFFAPAYDDRDWSTIRVPGHWELQGFAPPKYKAVDAGVGLYRTRFRVPVELRSGRLFLRFDGVQYGFSAWVNGRLIGTWASSYNPSTFDVTDAIDREGENILAVAVTTRSKGYEFDQNDCWALAGIYRDVVLFATPPTYLREFAVRTFVASGTARVEIEGGVAVESGQATRFTGQLRSPQGRVVGSFGVPVASDGEVQVTVQVEHPELWTAETPSLYRLELKLEHDGRVIEQVEQDVGLRQVAVVGGVLTLNGRPIKLRGVNHHDLDPDTGRTLSDARITKDLDLIQRANVNFIRTSHYPPDSRLLDACDRRGLYVLCEVPFGFGDEHLTDPSYQEILLTRARATVARDRNHPSVIIWSIGNENPVTDLTLATGREVKRLDPTRPICYPQVGSYFAQHRDLLPEFVDLYAPHYPGVDTIREYATTLSRPILLTEYAHALGLAADGIEDSWAIMQASPRYAGGAIWHFQDQGLRRESSVPADLRRPTPYVWTDAQHYFDTALNDGADGIVYSDRTPQVDYWEVRKTYAPIQVVERELHLPADATEVSVHVLNRYDFANLAGCSLRWTLRVNRAPVASGVRPLQAPAGQTEEVKLSLGRTSGDARDVRLLDLALSDARGLVVSERTLVVGAPADYAKLATESVPEAAYRWFERPGEIVVVQRDWEAVLIRASGELVVRDRAGIELWRGPFPHVGRRFTLAETVAARKESIWTGGRLTPDAAPAVAVSETGGAIVLRVAGRYPRPDRPEQAVEGWCTFTFTRRGTIQVHFEYKPRRGDGRMLEAGLALELPAQEFFWIGEGPYPTYPGKRVLAEFGLYHLNAADLRFSGNRMSVGAAAMVSANGRGVAVFPRGGNLAVEREIDSVHVAVNALVSGRGNKLKAPAAPISVTDELRLAGEFELLPLVGAWPGAFARWFGHPAAPADLQHPFYHSYDQ